MLPVYLQLLSTVSQVVTLDDVDVLLFRNLPFQQLPLFQQQFLLDAFQWQIYQILHVIDLNAHQLGQLNQLLYLVKNDLEYNVLINEQTAQSLHHCSLRNDIFHTDL